MPVELHAASYRDVFTGRTFVPANADTSSRELRLSQLLDLLPVAVLAPDQV
jgi:hypothetical protein